MQTRPSLPTPPSLLMLFPQYVPRVTAGPSASHATPAASLQVAIRAIRGLFAQRAPSTRTHLPRAQQASGCAGLQQVVCVCYAQSGFVYGAASSFGSVKRECHPDFLPWPHPTILSPFIWWGVIPLGESQLVACPSLPRRIKRVID